MSLLTPGPCRGTSAATIATRPAGSSATIPWHAAAASLSSGGFGVGRHPGTNRALDSDIPSFDGSTGVREKQKAFANDNAILTATRALKDRARALALGSAILPANHHHECARMGGRGQKMILADNETKLDLLNNEAIAATVVGLLRARPDKPVTVGIHGDWGAGKSSILEMIEATLEGHKSVLCLKFNGWRFQGFEDAKIALIEGIVTGLIEKRPAVTKAALAVKNVFKRIDWLKVAKKAGGLAFTAFTGLPTLDQVQSLVSTAQEFLSDPQKIASKGNLEAALEVVTSVLKPEESKNIPEEISEFRKAFDRLLKEAGIEQLVVLIDDLDRCLPDTAIDTLEAVRLFVFTSRTAFVVAADEAMIEYSVRKHFPDLPETTGPRDYARNYLEKLIQVPFRIPALGEAETRAYVMLLLVGAELGEDDPDFAKLIVAARGRLRRPWEGGVLDSRAVADVLGLRAPVAADALVLSEQIGPILAIGTKGNPRQIKRFLNSLLLRRATAAARGFADDVKVPALAKLMLAERFLPPFFDELASISAADTGGRCAALQQLELVGTEGDTLKGDAPAATKSGRTRSRDRLDAAPVSDASGTPEHAFVEKWKASKEVLDWARVQPPLEAVDLRPYLFVSKDRKDYFGAVTALGRLSAVVDRLLGPKMLVQSEEQNLRQLSALEAGQVFDGVVARIIAADAFEDEPSGAAGLAVLVKAQPSLQNALIDLLARLPRDRLGPWVVGGWAGALTDPAALSRFNNLINEWATGSKKTMLQLAAVGVSRMPKGSA